jgi:glyoxylase-like metal-dependent hydrolase (beta-lactamase superfamily II)
MTLAPLGSTLRVLRTAPGVLAFYDGRVPGVRAYSEKPNWLDDGAYELGIASYAIVEGHEALVYDTHMSLPHARIVRQTLADLGVTAMRVVLSHWHDDHVAGNEIFSDREIIAQALTAKTLIETRERLETGDPPIRPLVMPTRTYEDTVTLTVGGRVVELRHLDIHSHDATVLVLPDTRMLLAGDTLEDPITYVAEPDRLAAHLADLDRLASWDIDRILPCHGAPEIIAAGGYDTRLIGATRRYVSHLLACRDDPALAAMGLRDVIADDLASGAVRYFAPYEAVHRRNIVGVTGATETTAC